MPSASEKLTFGGLLSEETDLQRDALKPLILSASPSQVGWNMW